MFSSYPGTSPASYTGDVSYLQRAANRGDSSLHPPPHPPSTNASSEQQDGGEGEGDRGRASVRRKNSSGGLSRSSAYSVGGTRLSPTREGGSVGSHEGDEDAVVSDAEEEEERTRTPLHLGELYGKPDQPVFGHSTSTSTIIGLGTTTTAAGTGTGTGTTPSSGVTESTPLLAGPKAKKEQTGLSGFMHELKVLIGYSIPIAGTHFLEYSLSVVTVVSVGHIGTKELAGASIANMTANVVALSVIQGFCTALDTLCPQAYTSKPRDTSLYALRTFFLLLLLVIPQTIIFWNSEWLLLVLRQDPEVAERAGLYLKVMSFGLPGYAGFECVRRWLQAQGLMLAPVLTLVVAAPLNVLLNYLLVWGPEPFRLGFIGAPLATSISMTTMFFVSIAYAVWFAPRDAWGGFSIKMFENWGLNFRLGLAGTAMVASEWWCWEIVGLASSFLGPEALAAQSVLLTSASLFYQLPYAISVAGAVRAGNLLGSQRPEAARTTSRSAMALATAVAGINSLLLIVFRNTWGGLFSSEPDVIEVVAGVLPLVALFQLSDGLSGANNGLLRGAGKSTLGAVINLTSYYIIGLPVGLALTFAGPKLGLRGLWAGLSIALFWTAVFTSWVVWRLSWEQEAENARIRMGVAKRDPFEDDETGGREEV